MTAAVANHLWQSSLFVIAAALLSLLFRDNRAHVRFRIWFCASLKFLVPFALLMNLGTRLQPPVEQRPSPTAAVALQVSEPFRGPGLLLMQPPELSGPTWIPWAILTIWLGGSAGIALARSLQWRRIQAALRASTPLICREGVRVRSSHGLLEPGVAGWIQPVLLLPAGIESHLTPAQFEAILTHELCHIRRRDNLTSAIHMLVETVFWFHPLVWWIGAKLVEEREHACDEEVLQVTGDATAYAEAILQVCKRYVASPLACVSGVSSSDLKKRLEDIMMERIGLELNIAKRLSIAAASVAALALPIMIGILNTPVSAQSDRPRFANASVRIANCDADKIRVSAGGPPSTKDKLNSGVAAPGTLVVSCAPLGGEFGLIRQAYIVFTSGEAAVRTPTPTLTGGPDWLDSATFDIVAHADGLPKEEVMRGPMLQTLLEDKLKLKLHREARDSEAYALVADGAPRLKPFAEGTCVPYDLSKTFRREPGVKHCDFFMGQSPVVGPYPMAQAKGATLGDFGKVLGLALDRPVIDATGIPGRFDFQLEFGLDENTPKLKAMMASHLGAAATARPSILKAITEQYGLKLVPTKASREFLVIDHVERPSAN